MNSFCKLWRLLYSIFLPFVTQHFNKIHDDVFMDSGERLERTPGGVFCSLLLTHWDVSHVTSHVLSVFKKKWHSLLGQPVQSLPTLMVFFFSYITLESPILQLLPFVFHPSALHIWGSLTLSPLHLPKGGCSSTKISPFLKAGVMSPITSVS